MNTTRKIGLWIVVMPVFTALCFSGGCGKKEPVVFSLYCSSSHFPVADKLARTFRQAYGVTVICVPTDDATHAAFDVPEETDPPKIKSRYQIQKETVFASGQTGKLKTWIENAAYKNFGQYLLDNGGGDLYLCDSPDELQRLHDGKIVQKTRPLVYLTPVLLIHADKGSFFSVEDVLQSSETLGIVHRDIGGLGSETDRFLQTLRQKDSTLSDGKIAVYDNETLLLKAFEENQIIAVICWDSTAARQFPDIVPIPLPRKEVLAVPLTMCDLVSGSDYPIMDFFSIFLLSEKGQTLFKEFGYKVR